MSKCLVTGADGFIGRHLVSALHAAGHAVCALGGADGDIAASETLMPFDRTSIDVVFHLAGRTFVPDSWKDPVGFQRVNVLGTTNVLEFCRAHGARLTFVSAYLYGVPERLPVTEMCVPRPNNPYALSKHLAEEVCAFYAAHHEIHVTVIRPFNIFGPGQKPHFLIPKIIGQIREGRSIRVMDLAPRRDYVYIDDLVDALLKTLSRPGGYQVFNIGSGISLSVRDLIGTIQSVAGSELPVVSESVARTNELDDVYADVSKAHALLGWTPRHTFQQGIRKMISEERNL